MQTKKYPGDTTGANNGVPRGDGHGPIVTHNPNTTQLSFLDGQVSRREIKALAWLYRYPERRLHQAAIDNAGPLVKAAAAALTAGAVGMARVITAGGEVAELLDLVMAHEPDAGLAEVLAQAKRAAGATTGIEAAVSRYTAVMVMPTPYFHGDYPAPPEQHICRRASKVAAVGERVRIQPMLERRWRERPTDGLTLERCDFCYHDRVHRFCKQIEEEVKQYHVANVPLVYTTLPDEKGRKAFAKKLSNISNKGGDAQYTSFPLAGGAVVFVHNQKDMGGDELPRDRGALYDLVYQWADTPEGKRPRSTRGWGGKYQGTRETVSRKKDNGREQEPGEGTPDIETEPAGEIEIVVPNRRRLATLIEGAYGFRVKARGTYDLSIVDVCDLLDAAGMEYGFIKGREKLEQLRSGVANSDNNNNHNNTCHYLLPPEGDGGTTTTTAPPDPPEPKPIWEGLFS